MGSLPLDKAVAKRVRRTYLFLGDTLTLYMRSNEAEAKLVKKRTPTYPFLGDMLYKRFYDGTLLRSLYPDEASMAKECDKSLTMQGVAQPVNNSKSTRDGQPLTTPRSARSSHS
nr:uncharacterized protein LOC109186059 [Ipomoea batatas]GMD78394.1 uncharacterized protein LOC109186059 [Ipomoea batatas]GMD81294.1 uncharacterized protein LOC109186059 [Ipomoea batatas]